MLLVLGFSAGTLLGVRRPDPAKLSPYECGFEAFEDTRMKFDVRYYLVAILFIVFDLEIAFLFPWAVVFKSAGSFVTLAMAVFLAHSRGGFRLRVEEGSTRVGLTAATEASAGSAGLARVSSPPAWTRW